MTRVSENQAGGYPEGMDHEAQPVSGEPETGGVAKVDHGPSCQKCGGEIEGWTCQGCGQLFRENDAGDLIADAPVDQSGEAVAWVYRKKLDGVVWSERFLTFAPPDPEASEDIQPLYAAPVPTGGVSEEGLARLVMDAAPTIKGGWDTAYKIAARIKGASNA